MKSLKETVYYFQKYIETLLLSSLSTVHQISVFKKHLEPGGLLQLRAWIGTLRKSSESEIILDVIKN